MTKNPELAQIDYAFNNYYGRYVAPIVEKESKNLVQHQMKEQEKLAAIPMVNEFDRLNISNTSMKWSSKTAGTVVDASLVKVSNNKALSRDLQLLALEWDLALHKQLGDAKYNELCKKSKVSPAFLYLQERLTNLMCAQLSREGVPKTALGRVVRKSIQLSVYGIARDFSYVKQQNASVFDKKIETYHNRAADPKSKAERWASYAGSALLDTTIPAIGNGSKGMSIFKAWKIKGPSALVDYAFPLGGITKKGMATSAAIGTPLMAGMEYFNRGGHTISYEQESQHVINYAYGSSQAADKAWTAANKRYRNQGSLLLLQTNTLLHKKVKVGGLGLNDRANVLCNKVLSKNRSSITLNRSVSTSFDRQAIHYNAHAKVPRWMMAMSEKQCRSFGSKFYALAMELSRSRKSFSIVNGRKMSINEIAQRAFDYSHAAAIKREAIDAQNARAAQRLARHAVQAAPHRSQSYGVSHHQPQQQSGLSATSPQQAASGLYNQQNQPTGEGQQPNTYGSQMQQGQPAQQNMGYKPPSMGGWDSAMKQMGLSGFGDTWQNIGYVLAMLPDMLIGMFTGKNQNFKLENNYMPLAAIIAGMFFTKNSFLKMLLLGLGGANLLNNANHAMKHDGQSSTPVRQLKSYPDEPLNSRIKNPVIKGRSLLGTFDGKPLCITINSNETIYAYEKGALPLNTLANAILADMDKQQASASASYDRSIAEAEERQRTVGIK